jgi:hypothetical protein
LIRQVCGASLSLIWKTTALRVKAFLGTTLALSKHLCTDIYGPSESIIGEYLRESGNRANVQVLTKFCCFGRDMQTADSASFVKRVCTSFPLL